jgi:hypothetical protein
METNYACEVTIDHRRSEPFGGRSKVFISKKLARKNAAMEAIQWLEENGYFDDQDQRERPRKKRKATGIGSPSSTIVSESPNMVVMRRSSYAARVNGTSNLLKHPLSLTLWRK